MATHVLKSGIHATWNVNTSGDTWWVKKSLDFEVYNGDGISDTSAQHGNRFVIAGHIIALDGEGLDLYGRGNRVSITSSGFIETAHGYGIAFESTAFGGAIENHGRIKGELGGISMTGMSPQGTKQYHAEVVNYGRITANSYGIDSRSDDLTVINKHGGYIQGSQYGIGSSGNDVDIINHGTIRGGAQGAVYLTNGGDDTLTNAGKIIGDIFFNDGTDTFVSKGGSVTGMIDGGSGADTYVVDSTALNLHENDFSASDVDTVKSSVSWTLSDNFERLILTGSRKINGTGTIDAETIIGNAKANVLTGLGGDDMLRGGAGADRFAFAAGSGHDTIADFKDGTDRLDLHRYDGIDSLADITSVQAQGKDTAITLSSADTILLKDVSVHAISGADFLF